MIYSDEIRLNFHPSDESWKQADAAKRQKFFEKLGRIAYEVKRSELLQGLDRNGKKLEPTRTPRKDHSEGPPLCPHGENSRTITLLEYDVDAPNGIVRLYWLDGWGEILKMHAEGIVRRGHREPVRDVIGISPNGMAQIQREALDWWRREQAK